LNGPKVNVLLMSSISEKRLRVNNNLYCNLILRPGEKAPRIVLDSLDEWRALFAVLELFRRRGYAVQGPGIIKTSSKELHSIYSAGLTKHTTKAETGKAFATLAARRFNLLFGDDSGAKIDRPGALLAFEEPFTGITEIQINKIFYYNINGYYFNMPIAPLTVLTKAAQKVKARGRLAASDILMLIYACHLQKKRNRAALPLLSKAAFMFGLDARVDDRHVDRALAALEHGAAILRVGGVIHDFRLDNNTLFLTFKGAARRSSGRSISVARRENTGYSEKAGTTRR
jgi:hypothetical protein